MSVSVSVDQFWAIAEIVVNAARIDRFQALAGFTGNHVLLSEFARAIQVNGSRADCPEWLVKSLESRV